MPRTRTGAVPTRPRSDAEAAAWLPDLLAKQLNITAHPAQRVIDVSALIENIGLGRANGPFAVSIYVDLHKGGILTSFVQTFEVPASVSLAGEPVFAQALAIGPVGNISAFETSYVTPAMSVPLYYRDEDPSATYDAGFHVDDYDQVTESNKANNYYTWSGPLWWVTAEARRRRKPFTIERPSPS